MKHATTFTLISVALLLAIHIQAGGQTDRYRDPLLGPRDVLDIQVYGESNLSMVVVISASGDFSFPLLQRVKAAGRTADELGRYMEKRLKDERFLRNPSITVRIQDQKHFTVTLLGAVAKPGAVPIYPSMSIHQLLAEQGGIIHEKASPYIHIQRLNGNRIEVPREALENDEIDERMNDLALEPGDVVIVPEAKNVYVLGAVNKPGGYPLNQTLTLDDALGLAGGRNKTGGSTMLWHHLDDSKDAQLITFTYTQYQNDPEIRNSKVSPGDSIYLNQSDFIFIGGQVNRPGTFPWSEDLTLLSAIYTAGDLTAIADNTIWLIREDESGKQVKTRHSYYGIRKKGRDIQILPGDIIQVQPNPVLNIGLTLKGVNPLTTPITFFGNPIAN